MGLYLIPLAYSFAANAFVRGVAFPAFASFSSSSKISSITSHTISYTAYLQLASAELNSTLTTATSLGFIKVALLVNVATWALLYSSPTAKLPAGAAGTPAGAPAGATPRPPPTPPPSIAYLYWFVLF